ncbi:hypothetical protein JA1_000060 [Spathaspora sp. JA1]|nr:hypothetical protein JA1_000060 [Spathaspora sp. JA1]
MSLYHEYLKSTSRPSSSPHAGPSNRPPLSPTPSRPTFKLIDSCKISSEAERKCSTSPIPRTTPIGILLDDYNSRFLNLLSPTQFDDQESIISEARSLLTPDLKDGCESMNRGASPSDLAFFTYVSELKSTLPLLTHHTVSACNVLSQYLANEIFHANNLITLSHQFYNYDLDSFSYNKILNPYVPQDKSCHMSLIRKLKKLHDLTRQLISYISMFNSLVEKVNLFDVSFTNLLSIKAQFNYLINNYLAEEIEGISNKIKHELYQYNIYIEELKEQYNEPTNGYHQELQEDQCDDVGYATIENLKYKIEQTLTLKTNKLTRFDLQNFYEVLITGVIENAEWCNLIERLRDMV